MQLRSPTVFTKFGLHIGDRVRFVEDEDDDEGVVFGQEGVICTFEGHDDESVGVRWDKYDPKYHYCCNFCERGRGWYVSHHELVVVGIPADLGEISSDVNAIDTLFL